MTVPPCNHGGNECHPIHLTTLHPNPSHPMTSHLILSCPIHSSCQDNEEDKRKGARSVAAYMQLSDAVFTPYAESLYPTSGGEREVRTASGWWGVRSGPGRVS